MRSTCFRTRRTWRRWLFLIGRPAEPDATDVGRYKYRWRPALAGRTAGRSEFSAPLRLRPLRRVQETLEQRTELAGAEEILRMPLDTEAEFRGGIFNRLDDAVGRGGRRDESRRDLAHGLVVPAVDVAGVGVGQPLAHQFREERVLVDPHFVREFHRLMGRDLELV